MPSKRLIVAAIASSALCVLLCVVWVLSYIPSKPPRVTAAEHAASVKTQQRWQQIIAELEVADPKSAKGVRAMLDGSRKPRATNDPADGFDSGRRSKRVAFLCRAAVG